MTYYSLLSINEIRATIDVLGEKNEVISDYNRNFHLLGINSLHDVTFLDLHVVAMFKNI